MHDTNQDDARKQVEIHTDGACLGNPGPAAGPRCCAYGGRERELVGGEADTTNNRMELMAAIMALETLSEPCDVILHTDSQYVRQGITEWIAQLGAPRLEDRRRRSGQEPRPVGTPACGGAARTAIEWKWVKGHSGDPDNERVDVLARLQAQRLRGSSAVAR